MKAGHYRRRYGEDPVFLVFRQRESELDIMEINDFGKDFMALCDGGASLEAIAGRLHPRYGETMSFPAFLSVCRQTAEELAHMDLLGTSRQPGPRAGGE
jgi:hypothetical protein